jgi:hypothetical protein
VREQSLRVKHLRQVLARPKSQTSDARGDLGCGIRPVVFEIPVRNGGPSFLAHFGFRLVEPVAVASIVKKVKSAGGSILSKGEFAPGLPYVFFSDPDGYEVEVWFESRTPYDPDES